VPAAIGIYFQIAGLRDFGICFLELKVELISILASRFSMPSRLMMSVPHPFMVDDSRFTMEPHGLFGFWNLFFGIYPWSFPPS
jgi:hypothetical protein